MNVRYLTAAEAELQEAIDYYNQQHPGLGFELYDEVKEAAARINNYPLAWTPLSKRTRRAQVHRFPYSIVYEVRTDLIVIVAVQHHRRKPVNWRQRLRYELS
jgi:plasmid stabilization system protein ParE